MDAIGYARLSDKNESSNSIKSQVKRIEEYCAANKLTLLKTFIDDGRSGWTFDRPGFKELEQFCKKNKAVQYLVIPHFDRFSRTDPIDAMVKERYFRDTLNVKVLQVSEPVDIDVNNPTYLIVRFMQAFASNEERNRIVDRTITGMRYSLSQGRYCSNAPFGYKNSRDEMGKPLLIVDEERAPVIRFIFNQYLKGEGLEEIGRLAKAKGFTRSGNSAITRILQNPIYAGLVNVPAYKNQPARVVKGLHVPIVSENDYYMAMDKLSGKNFRHQNNEAVPLRGVVKCHCGKLLTAAPSKSKTGKYYWYYFCNDHRKANFSANKMHGQLLAILDELTMDKESAERIAAASRAAINEQINTSTKQLMKLDLAIQKAGHAISAIEEKYLLQPDISQATYNKVIKEKRIQLNELQAQRAAFSTDAYVLLEQLNIALSTLTSLRQRYEQLDVLHKQIFFKQGFGSNMTYTDGIYRTPFINPIFNANALVLKEKGLLIIEQPSENIALDNECAAGGTSTELAALFALAKLFVA